MFCVSTLPEVVAVRHGQPETGHQHIRDTDQQHHHANRCDTEKPNPAIPVRISSLLTTILGGVATSVIMPLINPAKASGIIRRAGVVFIRAATFSTTGIK